MRCPRSPVRRRWPFRYRRAVDSLGAPQVAGAAAVVLLLTLATRGGPRKRAELASFFAVTSIAATAAAVAFGYGWQYWVPAGAIAFGLIVVTNAAKLTVAVARIALPPIPAPGETVGNEELLDPVATDPSARNRRPGRRSSSRCRIPLRGCTSAASWRSGC